MIELQNIYRELGGKPVLCGVDLRIEAGETLVIVGSSGSGKSVTLQHMIGLLLPDRGQVLIDNEDINAVSDSRLEEIRDLFGVLFQSGALINWMTVFENVALPLYEKTEMGDAEIAARVRERLALVGLEGVEKKKPAELSGGMRKRAGLARAIVRDPRIILYDEPTSGLDPIMSRVIDGLIRDLQRQLHVTSVVVTHDLHSALTVGDRIALLHEGRIAELATPREFAASRHPVVRKFVEAQFAGVNLEELRHVR